MGGFRIQIEPEVGYENEDRSWLKTRKGCDTCRSITLDASLFTAAHTDEKGAVPSGTALALVAATGLYGPYDTGGAGGLETFRGLLFNTTSLGAEGGVADAPVGAPLFWEGVVSLAKLPTFDGTVAGEVDADAQVFGVGGTQIRWEA